MIKIESIGHLSADGRLLPNERNIRPGGTTSGLALFSLADFSIHVALIAMLGEICVSVAIPNLCIAFLRLPGPEMFWQRRAC